MELTLEYVADSPLQETFRLAFHSANERCLLAYPSVTGLNFNDPTGCLAAEWTTAHFISEPLDDFVLNPGSRIAFDLVANINDARPKQRWGIELPKGTYHVHYLYHVDRDTEWYDFLAKRSRFAALTPIWRGTVRSNTIRFEVQRRGNAE